MIGTRAIRALIAVAVGVSSATGCGQILGIEGGHLRVTSDAGGGTVCLLNSQCKNHQICIFKTCSPPCQADVDCDKGERCLETSDGAACVSASDAHCPGATCPGGTTCIDGECRTSCAGDPSKCRTDQICAPSGACVGKDPDHDVASGRDGGSAGTGGQRTDLDSSVSGGGSGGTGGTNDASLANGGGGAGGQLDSGTEDGGGGDGTAIGVAGQPCSLNGVFACTGHASQSRVSCQNGVWKAAGGCNSGENCDTSPGHDALCQTIKPECIGQTAGVAFCSAAGNAVLKCGLDLLTTTQLDTCQYVCTAGACTGECVPKTKSCKTDNLTPRTCGTNGFWQDGQACANLCSGGDCAGSCSPGTERCNGPVTVQKCDDTGAYKDEKTCTNQACVTNACTGVCTPGKTKCNGNSTEVCGTNGQWDATTLQDCPGQTCVNGACAGSCAPPDLNCDAATNGTETCDATGNWTTPKPCNSTTCIKGVCSGKCAPTQTACSGSANYETCDATGNWTAPKACTNKTCVGVACTGVCAPGQKTCSNNGVQTCNVATGQWSTPPATCTNSTCIGGVCTGSCAPGQFGCADANTKEVCDASTGKWLTTGCVGATPACLAGATAASCVACTPNANPTRCVSSCSRTPQYCNPSGAWADAADCAGATSCVSGLCSTVSEQIGVNTTQPNADNGAADLLIAQRIQITCQGYIQKLGELFGSPAAGTVRLALYSDTGGSTPTPGTILAATTATGTTVTAPTTEATANPAYLASAGYYWIVTNLSSQSAFVQDSSTGSARYASYPFATNPGFPSTFPASSVIPNTYALYAVVQLSP